jgi:hypothetical protein
VITRVQVMLYILCITFCDAMNSCGQIILYWEWEIFAFSMNVSSYSGIFSTFGFFT